MCIRDSRRIQTPKYALDCDEPHFPLSTPHEFLPPVPGRARTRPAPQSVFTRNIVTPDAASLLPAPLAATRTGLTPAGDDELITTDHLHAMISCRARAPERQSARATIRRI